MSYRLWVILLLLSGSYVRAAAQSSAFATRPGSSASALSATTALRTLSPQQIDNVVALGQVWGFLKYYHPAVAAGQRNWDDEFLRQLPPLLACRSVAERSRLLSDWVTKLGPVPVCSTCALLPTKPVQLLPDLRWAQQPARLSASLRQKLAFIAANPYQGVSYYVSAAEAGNPTFPHEEAYLDRACPSLELRLLAVCRFWNIVQYYYPYVYTLREEWPAVLPDLLSRFANASTPLAYRHAALVLAARLHDGHAVLRDPLLEAEQGNYYLAVALQFIDKKAVVVRVRHDGQVPQLPIKPGDVITHVEGVPVSELVRQRLPETAGSNQAAQLRSIALNLPYSTTPQLDLQLLRGEQALHVLAPCIKLGTVAPVRPALADSMYRFLTPAVGYIDISRITKAKLPVLMREFSQTKGIIVDLRGYPGEFVTRLLPGYFLAHPVPFATYSVYDTLCPGRFIRLPADTLKPAGPAPYAGQVVVLVNESTLSQAEFTAMALQATPHCILLGSQTAGVDGNVTRIVLPGGLRLAMSGIGIYYPDQRETQRIGLAADVVVHPTIAGLWRGSDELRERAVEIIMQTPAHVSGK